MVLLRGAFTRPDPAHHRGEFPNSFANPFQIRPGLSHRALASTAAVRAVFFTLLLRDTTHGRCSGSTERYLDLACCSVKDTHRLRLQRSTRQGASILAGRSLHVLHIELSIRDRTRPLRLIPHRSARTWHCRRRIGLSERRWHSPCSGHAAISSFDI